MGIPQNGPYENDFFTLQKRERRLILATGSSKIDPGNEIRAVRDWFRWCLNWTSTQARREPYFRQPPLIARIGRLAFHLLRIAQRRFPGTRGLALSGAVLLKAETSRLCFRLLLWSLAYLKVDTHSW